MPYITDEQDGLIHHNWPSVLADSSWDSLSYNFDASTLTADQYGLRKIYPGMLLALNPTTRMLNPATAAHVDAGTYQIWPTPFYYNASRGNPIVDVMIRGVLVERYCFGLATAGQTYTYANFGSVPAAVKDELPAVLWK